MSIDPDASSPLQDDWHLLVTHDWADTTGLEMSLCVALAELDADRGEVVLYDYVDVEAVRNALAPGSERGVSEVRFDYEQHEVRVADDGTIAVQ